MADPVDCPQGADPASTAWTKGCTQQWGGRAGRPPRVTERGAPGVSTPRPTVFWKSRVGGAIGPRPEPAGGHTRPGLRLLRAHTGGGASTDPAPRNWNRGCECWGLSYGDTHVTEHHTVRDMCVTMSMSGRTRTRTRAQGSRGHRARPGGDPPGPGGDYARIRTGDGTAGSEAAGRARASREGWQRGRLRGSGTPAMTVHQRGGEAALGRLLAGVPPSRSVARHLQSGPPGAKLL